MKKKQTQYALLSNEEQRSVINYDVLAHKYSKSSLVGEYRQLFDIFNLKRLIDRVRSSLPRPIERIVDLGCGEGGLTRALVQDGTVQLAVGIDLSKTMIDLATRASNQHGERLHYHVQDITDLEMKNNSLVCPLVMSTYVLCNARSTEQLFALISGMRQLCSDFLIGIEPNPFFPPSDVHKYRKYGWNLIISDQPKDGESIQFVFDIGTPDEFTFNQFWYSPETYENTFKRAGFRTFEWLTMEIDSKATEEQKTFYADITQHAICFIASV
jgi:SAM-dependent methyltransferase